jgi:triosephosphate isomerase
MRKNIVAGNWKMNGTKEDSQKLVSEIVNMYQDEIRTDTQVVLIPPFIALPEVQRLSKNSGIFTGAQNCHQEISGAYTGEISAAILKSFDISHVIVGHSERRQYFGEDNVLLAKKNDQVLAQQLIPIYCVGETLEERESGKHFEVIEKQISEGLFHLDRETIQKVVIAYEPVWAIGTGKTASKEEAQEIHAFIRSLLANKYGKEAAGHTSILYGGSVKPENARELFAQADIDGGLIGGAALKSRDFIEIVRSFPA